MPVGTTRSNPLVPLAAMSLAIISSLELKVSITTFAPLSFVKASMTSGASYSPQL